MVRYRAQIRRTRQTGQVVVEYYLAIHGELLRNCLSLVRDPTQDTLPHVQRLLPAAATPRARLVVRSRLADLLDAPSRAWYGYLLLAMQSVLENIDDWIRRVFLGTSFLSLLADNSATLLVSNRHLA